MLSPSKESPWAAIYYNSLVDAATGQNISGTRLSQRSSIFWPRVFEY